MSVSSFKAVTVSALVVVVAGGRLPRTGFDPSRDLSASNFLPLLLPAGDTLQLLAQMGKAQKVGKRKLRRHNPVRVPDTHLGSGIKVAEQTSDKKGQVIPVLQKVCGSSCITIFIPITF